MADCPGVHRLALTRDGALARIRVPGGSLTAAQMRAIASLASDEGNGRIDLTNRANLQVRGLSEHRAPAIATRLADAGLLCADPVADRLRNITASPLSGLDTTALLDVRQMIPAIEDTVCSFPHRHALSVKFAVVLGDGGRAPMTTVAHDLAFYAEPGPDAPQMRLWLAGRETQVAVAAADVSTTVARALELMAERGASRIRELIANLPHAECADAIAGPHAFHCQPHEATEARPWLPLGTITDARAIVAGVPLAQFSPEQLSGLADILDTYGTGALRLTPWQSVVVPLAADAAPANAEAALGIAAFETRCPPVHVVACAGASGCLRTTMDTKRDAAALRKHFAACPAPVVRSDRTVPIVHLSGCARSCAMTTPADVLALAQEATDESAGDSATYALYDDTRPSCLDGALAHSDAVNPDALTETVTAMFSNRAEKAG
ncbi:MAG: precorrin-3B synthase [Pseudomonadota bacterium]